MNAIITSPPLSMADITKWFLMCAAATFGAIFAWNIISPVSVFLAVIVAVSVVGLNFAEGYLTRFCVAAWRFGFDKVAIVSACGVLLIMSYSILAGSSVIQSHLIKNQQSGQATDFEIKAAQQRIQAAKEDSFNSMDFGNRQSTFLNASAIENEKIAALLRNKPANNTSVKPSTAATLVAVAIEIAIIGLAAFTEVFQRPTPLPAVIKFEDKLVQWGLNSDQLQNLEITASPSAGTVGLKKANLDPPAPRTYMEKTTVQVHAKIDEKHAQKWLELIAKKEIKPTKTAAKNYLIKMHKVRMEDAQDQAPELLERGYNLGLLEENPKKGVGQAEFVFADQKKLGQGGIHA